MPGRFVKKPAAPLGLVDPIFQQAGARDVVLLVAERVHMPHLADDQTVVMQQFRQHVGRRDLVDVVVSDALQATDVPDRPDRRAAELAHALRDGVGRAENLRGLLVQQQVIVAEVRSRDVPVKNSSFLHKG